MLLHSRYFLPALTSHRPDDGLQSFGNLVQNYDLACERFERGHPSSDKVEFAKTQITKAVSLCESPIEREMVPWLVLADLGEIASAPHRVFSSAEEFDLKLHLFIVPQFELVSRRVDFAIVASFKGRRRIFAFECDGLGYHNRRLDIVRDGELAECGILTIRAWGAEIKKSPSAVCSRVQNVILTYMDEE